jgi:hypothetical protein
MGLHGLEQGYLYFTYRSRLSRTPRKPKKLRVIHRQEGDFIRLLEFFQNKESRLQRWSHKHRNKNLGGYSDRRIGTDGYRDRRADTDGYIDGQTQTDTQTVRSYHKPPFISSK